MKTLLRTLLYLALIVWLGAEVFFPVVATVAFSTLMPDVHAAGTIVGDLLRILHGMGLYAGVIALVILAIAPAAGVYKARTVIAPMVLLVLMLACTAYSQYGIIPAMDRDLAAAGGTISPGETASPIAADFNRLHNRSETVEEAIDLLGILTVVLVAWAESAGAEKPALVYSK